MPRRSKSRKNTPWEGLEELTPTQEFLQMHYIAHYDQRHPKLSETGEAAMINSYESKECPYCASANSIRKGHDANGVRRYRCLTCGQTYRPTTKTIFDSRKISISEWIEYCLNILATRWFRAADPMYLMSEEERKVYNSFENGATVYRGVAVGRNPMGLSWTDNYEEAFWFAHRFDIAGESGYVQKAQVPRDKMLAYFLRRGEYELVVDTKGIEITGYFAS